MKDQDVQELRAKFRGELITPGDAAYDGARKVYNGMIDKRPALIASCADVADVVAAVNLAREKKLLLAVRGGGHNGPGLGVCDGGLVIDLSRLKGIRVDPARRVVRAEGGCTWGDVDHATHAFGLATRDEAERMSGHHEAHILIIVTEGSAVSDETFDGIFSMMASGDVRLLVLSNPTRNEGEVYEIAQGNRSNWYVLQVSGWDLPNLLACTKLGEEHLAKSAEQLERDGDCPNPTPYLLTHLFERETAENFGEDSDYYAIHVLGKHGRSGKDQLIPREWIDLAFEREPLPGKAAGGLDIARGGRDHSAYAEVNGNAIVRLEEWSKLEPNQTVGRMLGILEDRDFPVAVDDTGLGGGVAPLLKETYRKVFGIDFSERAEDETRFANKPAEMYWYLRKRLDPDGPDPLSFKLVPAPARKRMTLQMLKPTFATKDSKGRLSVDKKGGGSESPDTTDAIILALEAQGRAGYSGIRLNREYDRTDPDLRRSEFAGVGEKRF